MRPDCKRPYGCARSLECAGAGKAASHFSRDRLVNINAIFDRMKAGQIDGRIVLEI